MSSDLRFEELSPADIPGNLALSTSVGWKDVESEWRVLHEAATVFGAKREGCVVAQGALGDYGGHATLAKMVVSPELQGQRIGGRLLDTLLARADAQQAPVGLVATDRGRPLYASRGFHVSGELAIFVGKPALPPTELPEARALSDAQSVIEHDRRVSGCDRGRMLRARFRESIRRAACESGSFVLASQQGESLVVGPVIADSDEEAFALVAHACAGTPGLVRLDVPIERTAFRAWLTAMGLREVAVRVEMSRGAVRSPWQTRSRYALATQAWG